MNIDDYQKRFEEVILRIDKKLLEKSQLTAMVGKYENSLFLKLIKKGWLTDPGAPAILRTSIFFSIWINDQILIEEKLYYNIHAFKLRELKGYAIKSRGFAENFRERFKAMEAQWPNVSTAFGPQTLMQGWVKWEGHSMESEMIKLIQLYEKADPIIDQVLALYRK